MFLLIQKYVYYASKTFPISQKLFHSYGEINICTFQSVESTYIYFSASPPAAAPAPPPSDAGGFAPPPPTDPEAVPLEGEEGVEQPEPQEEHVIDEEAAKAKKVWMDFEIFCKCFK